MQELDYEIFRKNLDDYKKYVNSKHWADLTNSELEYVIDKSKLKNRKKYLDFYIIPLLYSMKNKSNFKFSHSNDELTCRNMRDDIQKYYRKLNYDQHDLYKIASDREINKY